MATGINNPVSSTASTFTVPVGHRISWGAIIAGVSLFITLSWLLLMLGSAIGVGVADASDLGAIGEGLGLGSVIWILISTILAVFAGGMLAAKLSGTIDDRIGALHGLTVWSVGTLLVLAMSAAGLGGTLNAIGGAFDSTNKMTTKVVSSVSGSEGGSMLPDALTTSIAAVVKRQAASVIDSNASAIDSGEVRQVIEQLNAQDAGAITSALVSGDMVRAADELADRTTLTELQISNIVDNAKGEINELQNSDEVQQAQQWLNKQISQAQNSASQMASNVAGSQVSSSEINRALENIAPETLLQAGQHLVMGEVDSAKNVLAVNTNLSQADIDAVVDGAEKEVTQLVNKAKAQANEVTEAVATYTQAVLWSIFIASALGLLAGAAGGHLGAGAVRRIYAVS